VGKLWGILLSISPVHSSIGGGFDLTFGIFAARGLFCLLFELSPASWGRLIHVRSTPSNIRRFWQRPIGSAANSFTVPSAAEPRP
jgi:hypothetical protein